MRILILSFSANQVNEDSFIPNKMGLTYACVEECKKELESYGYEAEHICMNSKNIKRCLAFNVTTDIIYGKKIWRLITYEFTI